MNMKKTRLRGNEPFPHSRIFYCRFITCIQ